MSDKTTFTAEEWSRLLSSPLITGIAITAADPSGVWGLLKEGMAGGSALLEARQNSQANPLVRAVAEDFATSEGRSAAKAALQAKFSGTTFTDLKNTALSELKAVASVLDGKSPEDSVAFKTWLQQVAMKAAEAGTEGGFLGFGGVAVSEAEKSTLAEIAAALGRQSASA